ncbi:hypothetical protein MFIFM68171_11278 [Madurella fahalii]|uniref:Uncharacterized protein n=1 Tax=Madurella fahalii TaxID=1157608 RepID=A0ABQ0GTJ7_9PEZI
METTSSGADESTWDEIEKNYFESMRVHRQQQRRVLEDEYRAKNNEIKSAMLDNFRAQSELRRQLQALKEEHKAKEAALKTLEIEFEAVLNAQEEDNAREDEMRLAWFRKFRRGGLAYRTADASRQEDPTGPDGMGDAGKVVHGCEQEALTADSEMPDAREVGNGRVGNGHGPKGSEAENEMMMDTAGENGQDQHDVEVIGGPELPEEIGATRPDQEANGTEAVEEPCQPPRIEDVPADKEEPDPKTGEERAVTPDVGAPADNGTNGVVVPNGASIAPAVPGSPSSLSSELSSRHTTPALDTPVSQAKEPTRPATPADIPSDAVEVYDESGELVGQLLPIDRSNQLVERIMNLPIKRPVRLRKGRKFTAQDLELTRHPPADDKRGAKWLSFYIQATGEVQARPCQGCSINNGLYQECIVVDDGDFPRCGNCEWNKRGCHGASLQSTRPRSRQSASGKSPGKPLSPESSFTPANGASKSGNIKEEEGSSLEAVSAVKKALRRPLPDMRKAHSQVATPSAATPLNRSPDIDDDDDDDDRTPRLPEITKAVLCLRDDGMVFTDPPMMRGVPLAKIGPDHPYWESDWVPTEEIVEPILQKYQEKYEKLEEDGSKPRDKHLAHRDAKRGRTILKFLREGDLHPYQLVGKEVLNPKITTYEALYRMAQLLMEDLPKFNLDITPSEWLRHRIHEVYLEKGNKFNLSHWLEKAYSDPKVEQGREMNGLPNIGRPPAHRKSKGGGGGGGGGESARRKTAPRALKRKEPHATPESTPQRVYNTASSSKPPSAAAATPASATAQHKAKGKAKMEPPAARSVGSTPNKKQRVALGADAPVEGRAPSAGDLAYDGYTSTDSISQDRLMRIDWRVHQVKTRDIASNSRVTQYWHWLGDEGEGMFEHQVLRSVRPPKWSVFKDPYDFHLRIAEIERVLFAPGNGRVVIEHKKGPDGEDVNVRGDVMAQFKRERTKRRFLSFLKQHGVKLAEVNNVRMEMMWDSLNPETLPAGDSD